MTEIDMTTTAFDEIQDEDDRVRAMNERRTEWWMANFDYLPIHHFRQKMRKYCYELSTFPTAKRLTEIIRDVDSTFTNDVEQEIRREFEFYYGKGIIEWASYTNQQIVGGYLSDYKLYLSKLMSVYVRGRKDLDHALLWTAIDKVYSKCFGRQGDWYDAELERIHKIMTELRRRRDESSQRTG